MKIGQKMCTLIDLKLCFIFCWRNRKHFFVFFYQVKETIMEVWENSKKLWKHYPDRPHNIYITFLVLPNFHLF